MALSGGTISIQPGNYVGCRFIHGLQVWGLKIDSFGTRNELNQNVISIAHRKLYVFHKENALFTKSRILTLVPTPN